jgi:hypothetical protein
MRSPSGSSSTFSTSRFYVKSRPPSDVQAVVTSIARRTFSLTSIAGSLPWRAIGAGDSRSERVSGRAIGCAR